MGAVSGAVGAGGFSEDFSDDFDYSDEEDGIGREEDGRLLDGGSDDFSDDFGDMGDAVGSTSGLIGVTTVLKSEQLSPAETVLNLSPEDLENGVFVEEDEDLIAFNELKAKLEGAGYHGLDDLDFDVLKKIQKRSEIEKGSEAFLDMYTAELLRYVEGLVSDIAGSRATLESTKGDIDRIAYLKNNGSFRMGDNAAIAKFIDNVAYSSITKDSGVDVESIYSTVVSSPLFGELGLDFDMDDLHRFIMEVTPIISNYNRAEINRQEKSDAHRRKIAEYVVRREVGLAKKMRAAFEAGNLAFIKHIKKVSGKYYVECPSCKKLTLMGHAPGTVVRFDNEKNDEKMKKYLLPEMYVCECGTSAILTPGEYNDIRKYVNRQRVALNNAIKYSASFCKGASCVKVEPAISLVEEPLSYLISEDRDVDGEEGLRTGSISEKARCPLDEFEFEKAVAQFYQKLKCLPGYHESGKINSHVFSGTEQDGKDRGYSVFGHYEIALYFCDVLSMDYTELKNRAVFSLLMYIKENPLLCKYLDLTNIIEPENAYQFISSFQGGDVSRIELDKKQTLINFVALLNARMGREMDYSKVTGEQLIRSLLSNLGEAGDIVRDAKSSWEKVMGYLEENTQMFSFCKIVNLASFRREDIVNYLSDRRMLKWVDTVTDRMIIYNYSDKFYEHWERLALVNCSVLSKGLKVRTDTAAALRSIVAATKGLIPNPSLKSRLGIVYIPIAEKHETLQNAVKALRGRNFYRFCREVVKIPLDLQNYVVPDRTYRLSIALMELHDMADGVLQKSEVEFFLGGEFSREELQKDGALFDSLVFEDIVLKRLEGETPAEYVRRFREVQKDYSFGFYETVGFFGHFEKNAENILELVCASIPGSLDYGSYTTGAYMRVFIDMIFEGSDLDYGLPYISPDDIRGVLWSLGMTPYMLNSYLCRDGRLVDAGIDVEGNLDLARVRHGLYFTGADKFVDKVCKAYDDELVSTSDSLGSRLGSGEMSDVFAGLLAEIVGSDDIVAEDRVYDSDDMWEEVSRYLSDRGRKLAEGEI